MSLPSQFNPFSRKEQMDTLKFVKKDCGIHSGPTSGPCAKCNASRNSLPSSIANSLEGIVRLSTGELAGVEFEFTSNGEERKIWDVGFRNQGYTPKE